MWGSECVWRIEGQRERERKRERERERERERGWASVQRRSFSRRALRFSQFFNPLMTPIPRPHQSIPPFLQVFYLTCSPTILLTVTSSQPLRCCSDYLILDHLYPRGTLRQRPNLERPIFRNFKILNITKNESRVFLFVCFEFFYFYVYFNCQNTQNTNMIIYQIGIFGNFDSFINCKILKIC